MQERDPPKRNDEEIEDIVEYAPEKVFPEFSLPPRPITPKYVDDDPRNKSTYTKREAQEMVEEYFSRPPHQRHGRR